MSRTEIRITGFGGQGVVCPGYVIGRACAVNAGQHATMIQSFGPGGARFRLQRDAGGLGYRGALSLHPQAGHLRGHVR